MELPEVTMLLPTQIFTEAADGRCTRFDRNILAHSDLGRYQRHHRYRVGFRAATAKLSTGDTIRQGPEFSEEGASFDSSD